jgi:eukaryotic-like serine/threonine-protein kinase
MNVLAQLTTTLAGRYAVEREIGHGGMATVYLARDVRHARRVALKVLNPELGAVLGVERFLAEIQVTANLQHPNLLPLFDSGEADGLLFYVMPYVEGESLRARLQREKQLPIDDAIRIATAIAGALDYAHRHGVIHRDLKPENVLLHDGQPLVADFGIALAVSNAGGNRITQTGLSLGTPHYMSPEQATGDREIDGRTDIYSLGAVLYEMLCGEPPHDGKTSQAIIAKVLTDKPRSIHLTRDTVPAPVEAAVERALAKLPADRFHTAHDFSDALTGRNAPTGAVIATTSAASARPPLSPVRAWTPWVVAGLSLVMAGIGWGLHVREGSTGKDSVMRYEIRMSTGSALMMAGNGSVAVSPDGRFVAYTASGTDNTRRLYLRAANEITPREVPGSVLARAPFFSPDGVWVAFWASGQLKKAPVNGGAAVLLAELPNLSQSTWTTTNQVITSNGRLLKVAATGGTPMPFSKPDTLRGEIQQLNPVALHGGKKVLYTALGMGGATGSKIGIASIEDGTSKLLDVQGSFPLGVVDGILVYSTSAGTIMGVPFDEDKGEVTGAPVPLVDQVASEVGSPLTYASLSADGTLLYVTGTTRRQLSIATGDGSARPIIPEAGAISHPRLSPNGRHIAMTVGSSARSDVWVYDLPSGPFARLTTEGNNNDRPEWMPDSRTVVFRSSRGGLNAAWAQPIDGSAPARLLFGQSDAKVDETVVSPDGQYLLFQRDQYGLGELWYRAMSGDTTPKRVGNGAFGETGGRFSPDGKWVAYGSSEAGSGQVYVRPFPGLNARYQVSLNGGATPVWSADMRRIYYVAERQLMAATITSFQPFTIGARDAVLGRAFSFGGTHADYDVARDGRSFIALRSPDQDVQLVIVHNWASELRARMRGTQ